MLVASSSPVKFSKIAFSGVKFRAKFEVVLQKQFLSVFASHSKSNFSTVKLSGRKRRNPLSVYRRNYLNYSIDQRGKRDWNWLLFCLKLRVERNTGDTGLRAIKAASYKRPNKFSQLQNTQPNLLTVSDLRCHLKVNKDKLALINRRWKCKKGKGWPLTLLFIHENWPTRQVARTISRRYGDHGQR